MQQSYFEVASKTDQPNFKRLFRISIFLMLLLAIVGIAALGTRANRVAASEVAGSIYPGATLAVSNEFSNGMPLP